MTPILAALACAVLVQIATLALMAVVANRELGRGITLGPRDGAMPPLSQLLGRLHRSTTNGFEALGMFTPAALVAHLAGVTHPVAVLAAWAFVVARILYVPAYAFGLVPWRSVVWGMGFLSTLTLILACLI